MISTIDIGVYLATFVVKTTTLIDMWQKCTGRPVNFVTPVKFVTYYKSVQGLELSIL